MCGKLYADRSGLRYHKKRCKEQTLSQQIETASNFDAKDQEGEEVMDESVIVIEEFKLEEVTDDPRDNSDLSVNDSNSELIIIEGLKLEPISEEDNEMVEIPTQVKDNQISDIIKSEILESDYINQKTTCHGDTSSLLQNQVTASDILFADYEGTIKQEI